MSSDLVVASSVSDEAQLRAAHVAQLLQKAKQDVEMRFYTICDLLAEAKDNDYHNYYGYATFGDWVEAGSGLDMSARQAFYYINISKKIKQLDLPSSVASSIGLTKLKDILSLPIEQEADIRGLLEAAPTTTVAEVKKSVAKAKAKDGQEPVEYVTLRLDSGVKAIVDKAFKLAQLVYGEDVIEGEAVEPTHSKCMELICLAYTQDPENYPAGVNEAAL
jgi:hypothetical protein